MTAEEPGRSEPSTLARPVPRSSRSGHRPAVDSDSAAFTASLRHPHPERSPEIPEIPEILKSDLKCPEIH